jgi:hypothetical protein
VPGALFGDFVKVPDDVNVVVLSAREITCVGPIIPPLPAII